MTTKPITGFNHFYTHHCVSGAMAHIYHFHDHPLSEDLLLGVGEGIGYIYWHQKGQTPFMGGRAQPKPSMEELAAARTGVKVISKTTSSGRKAQETLLAGLAAEQPVMLQVDMGFLPYFDFGGEEYHFGGHAVVACGYDADEDTVLIADRDAIYPVPIADLAQARGSTFKPFPPKNRWLTFDFSEKRLPLAHELRTAIHHMATLMLEPPISNIGVKGIRKTAVMMPQWPKTLSPDEIKWTLFNAYIFISAAGGTGGGTFRYMLSRFLCETAVLLEDGCYEESSRAFQEIGDAWEEVGAWCRQMSENENAVDHLGECVAPLQHIADLEEAAWTTLYTLSSPQASA